MEHLPSNSAIVEHLPSNSEIKEISDLAAIQLSHQRRVAALEADLKGASAALRRVQEVDLPDAMTAAGVQSITLPTGEKVTIKDGITASVPKDRKTEVCDWLREHGFGDLVSEEVSVSFGRGEEKQAAELAQKLRADGLQPVQATDVNTARLKALITEQMEKGVDVPLDMFGAVTWTKAMIK